MVRQMNESRVTPLLEMRGIHKRFPGVHALNEVNLSLYAGEVLALLGENGAGKSTLIKMLGGAHQPDEGEIWIEGEGVVIDSATAAREVGVAVIYQEFNLIPELSVSENLFLGREKTYCGLIDLSGERREALKWLDCIGLDIDPDSKCGDLTVAQQQVVEIVKALAVDARILVMDEPSAVLTAQEVERLFQVVRDLKERGIGVIYISHRLDEIDSIADRLLVLRDGQYIGGGAVSEIGRDTLIEMMVGRSLEKEFPPRDVTVGEEVLRVEGLNRGTAVKEVSFSVKAGEIVGFSGLVGAGRTETMRLIAGADPGESGEIWVNGELVSVRSPRDAIAAGVCLLSEDRKKEGLVLSHSSVDNFGLPNLEFYSRKGWLNDRLEQNKFDVYRDELAIKVAGPDQLAGELSGGNQQKVVLAKWLARRAHVMLFDEPTRGIDVGAKYEIYQLMNRLAGEGKAIIMVSSELPEILGMSDRIIVMKGGCLVGEVENGPETTQEDILALAMEEPATV